MRMSAPRSTTLRRGMVTTGAVLCSVALFAGSAGAAGTPGKPSIGDPYYPTDGNTGYDARHYDLRLGYQPGADRLSGTATILARTTQDLSRFSLDFGITPSSVLVNNAPAAFTSGKGKLTVTPKTSVRKGRQLTVVVRYSGVPSTVEINGEKAWVKTPDGALAANEPHAAAFWYPVNDHPRDKATYDISVAVPTGTQVVSNGVLTDRSAGPNDTTRFSWRGTSPRASYLSLLAIGRYQVHVQKSPDGQPFTTAYDRRIDPATTRAAKASLERTPEVTSFLASRFGPYPFESNGGTVSTALSYALETQTQPVYGDKFFEEGGNSYIIAHEVAHQWFGDSVSPHGWRDIWNNEGFASYAEWLWSEDVGEGTTQELFDFTYASYPANDEFWQVLPGDPGPENQFDGAVYDRGAMTVQALRNRVGDRAFFTVLREWTKTHRNADASIGQFVALAEQVSGKNLRPLFRTWLYTKGRPAPTVANGFPAGAAARTVTEPASYQKIQRTHAMLDVRHAGHHH